MPQTPSIESRKQQADQRGVHLEPGHLGNTKGRQQSPAGKIAGPPRVRGRLREPRRRRPGQDGAGLPLERLGRLRTLGLSGNGLTALPRSLAALGALEALHVSDNRLTVSGPGGRPPRRGNPSDARDSVFHT